MDEEWNKLGQEDNDCTLNARKANPTLNLNTNNPCADLHAKVVEKGAEFSKEQSIFTSWEEANKPKQNAAEFLKSTLDDMKKSGASLSALIVSGHDGGGHFYGDIDEITKEQFFSTVSQYPDQTSVLNTAMLMGCWSTVSDEIDQWKTMIPSLKILAGFVGSAPASTYSCE